MLWLSPAGSEAITSTLTEKLATITWIEGKYVGTNGKATGATRNYGWITKGSSTYYYDAKGNKVKGWLQLEGKLYYLNPSTGALQKGWLTIGGRRYYAGPAKGVILRNQWFSGKYLKNDGSVAVGWTSVGSDTYYFSTSGASRPAGSPTKTTPITSAQRKARQRRMDQHRQRHAICQQIRLHADRVPDGRQICLLLQ